MLPGLMARDETKESVGSSPALNQVFYARKGKKIPNGLLFVFFFGIIYTLAILSCLMHECIEKCG